MVACNLMEYTIKFTAAGYRQVQEKTVSRVDVRDHPGEPVTSLFRIEQHARSITLVYGGGRSNMRQYYKFQWHLSPESTTDKLIWTGGGTTERIVWDRDTSIRFVCKPSRIHTRT